MSKNLTLNSSFGSVGGWTSPNRASVSRCSPEKKGIQVILVLVFVFVFFFFNLLELRLKD